MVRRLVLGMVVGWLIAVGAVMVGARVGREFRAIEYYVIRDNRNEAFYIDYEANFYLSKPITPPTDSHHANLYHHIWSSDHGAQSLKHIENENDNYNLIYTTDDTEALISGAIWLPWYTQWDQNSGNIIFSELSALSEKLRVNVYNTESGGVSHLFDQPIMGFSPVMSSDHNLTIYLGLPTTLRDDGYEFNLIALDTSNISHTELTTVFDPYYARRYFD
ncbi:MAG: hypothetical protein AAF125_08605 [Chloroflexota bacterium]